jgi:anti-sigma regulatory factor (Ser/Thr protein kinase)
VDERRFPRAIASLDAIFATIADFLREHGLDGGCAFDLDLIAEELFTNMVKYGGTGGDVGFALAKEGDVVTMVFRDIGGPPYDVTLPRPLPGADTPLAERRPGGLGLHLVQRIADRLDYRHDGRTGTITVTKRIR